MKPPQRSLGLTLAFASAASNAVYVLGMRRATLVASAGQVVLALLFFAAVFNTLSFAVKAAREGVPPRSSAERILSRAAVSLSVLTVAGNYAAGRTIALLHPAVASVLIQLQVLFAATGALLFLGESIGLAFVLGSLVALLGVAVMQWHEGPLGVDVWAGTGWGLATALAFGLMQVITRSVATRVEPLRFNAERLWLSVLWLALVPGNLTGTLQLSGGTILLTAIAACFGPFLGRVALIYAARHLPAGLTVLVGLLTPVVVLAVSVPLFGTMPARVELIGGALAVCGTLLALLARAPSSAS